MLVEGRHFAPGAEPRALGHKALAVNLSDLAAMGAAPRWALLAIALPAADPDWLGAFAAGLFALAERHGVELVGGVSTSASASCSFGMPPERTVPKRAATAPMSPTTTVLSRLPPIH